MKKFLLISPLIVLCIITAFGFASLYQHKKNIPIVIKLQLGEKVLVPEFSISELYNQAATFSNQDLKNQYSIINIFASWCSSCKAEHKLLMQLFDEKKINIYGIAWMDIDYNTKEYLSQNGNPYLKIGLDSKGVFSKIMGIKAVPESFIVDTHGKIIYHQEGMIDEKFISFVNKIL